MAHMLHEVSFKSFNQRDEVQGWIYVPAAKPKGIVQLIHGFGEHSRRYLHMIVGFLSADYIVAADDHVGHGKTAIVNHNSWGDWGDQGVHTMMEDEHRLHDIVVEKYPDLPYFLFGHSMGSFIARDYISSYGDGLAGVTLCGTAGVFPHCQDAIELLEKDITNGQAKESDAQAANLLLGWMFSRCEEGANLGNEWICHDKYVQYDHANDPFDAFTKPTNNQSFLMFAQMIQIVTGMDWAENVPKALPIYNIAGDQDPVGQFGTGVYQVSNWLIDSGHQVSTKLYPGYRHEIHNYKEIQNEVVEGIVQFMDQNL